MQKVKSPAIQIIDLSFRLPMESHKSVLYVLYCITKFSLSEPYGMPPTTRKLPLTSEMSLMHANLFCILRNFSKLSQGVSWSDSLTGINATLFVCVAWPCGFTTHTHHKGHVLFTHLILLQGCVGNQEVLIQYSCLGFEPGTEVWKPNTLTHSTTTPQRMCVCALSMGETVQEFPKIATLLMMGTMTHNWKRSFQTWKRTLPQM